MSVAKQQLRHLGIILDGNRRWAKEKGVAAFEGHRRGAEVFKEIALNAFDNGVTYLSAFVFSTENYTRPQEEVSYLMKLVIKAVEKYLDEFHKKNIKIVVAGTREKLEENVLTAVQKTEEKTKHNSGGTLILCFSYGGRQEIVDAVQSLVKNGTSSDEIDEAAIAKQLYQPEVPDVDLIIRTSGEQRTSGFMLWRAAYAELVFCDKYWPDFTTGDLTECIQKYNQRNRRFGA